SSRSSCCASLRARGSSTSRCRPCARRRPVSDETATSGGSGTMRRVLVIEAREHLRQLLAQRLAEKPAVSRCDVPSGGAALPTETPPEVVVYGPPTHRCTAAPELSGAETLFRQCAERGARLVLLSSAAVYGAHTHNQGLLPEVRLSSHTRKN